MNSPGELSPLPLDQISPRKRLHWCIGLLLPIVVLGVAGLREQDDLILLALGIAVYVLICIPVLFKRTYYIVEPYSIIFWMLYLGVPAKIVWSLHNRDTSEMDAYMLGMPIHTLGFPTVLTGLAITTLVIGYMLGRRFSFRSTGGSDREAPWNKRTVLIVSAILVMVSVAAFALYARQVGISFSGDDAISAKRISESEESGAGPMGRGSSLAYFRWLISLSQIAFYVVLAWSMKSKWNRSGIIAMLFVLCVPMVMAFLMPFVTSSRTPLIFFLVESLVILYCLNQNVLTGRWLSAQVLGAVAVIALFLMILVLRRDPRAEDSGLEEFSPIALIDHVVGARYLADITKNAQIIRAFPDILPYQYGVSYTSVLAAPVPRNWWPGKPSLGLGPYIGEKVYGMTHSGVPPGLVGESYLNFGMFGLVLVPFLFGFVVRSSFESFKRTIRRQADAIRYAVCFRFYVGALGIDFSTGLIQFLMELIPLMFVIWLLQLRRSF